MSTRLAAFEKFYTWIDSTGLDYFRRRLIWGEAISAHSYVFIESPIYVFQQQRLHYNEMLLKHVNALRSCVRRIKSKFLEI